MNPYVTVVHARGLGALGTLGDFWDDFGGQIFKGGFDFGQSFLKAWERRGVAAAGQPVYFDPYKAPTVQQPPQLTQEQAAAIARAQAEAAARAAGDGGTASIRFTDEGLKLGKTTVSYPLMLGGFVVVLLLQSKPFGRK